jgi:hypothetical protein
MAFFGTFRAFVEKAIKHKLALYYVCYTQSLDAVIHLTKEGRQEPSSPESP